jgi:hypothetical protein
MDTGFLHSLAVFPSVILTIPLGIALGYWLFVILGWLWPESGAGEGLEASDAGDVEAEALDSGDASEWEMEFTPPDGAELSAHHALDTHSPHHAEEPFWYGCLAGVPLSISLSVWLLFAWIMVATSAYYLRFPAPWHFPGASLILLAGLWCALPLTRLALQPLRPIFICQRIPNGAALVGQTCTISTGQVDDNFGQAVYDNGGAGIVLMVRAGIPNDLRRGTKALLVDYNPRSRAYQVAPLPDNLDTLA